MSFIFLCSTVSSSLDPWLIFSDSFSSAIFSFFSHLFLVSSVCLTRLTTNFKTADNLRRSRFHFAFSLVCSRQDHRNTVSNLKSLVEIGKIDNAIEPARELKPNLSIWVVRIRNFPVCVYFRLTIGILATAVSFHSTFQSDAET